MNNYQHSVISRNVIYTKYTVLQLENGLSSLSLVRFLDSYNT